jgi:hypothetical protein
MATPYAAIAMALVALLIAKLALPARTQQVRLASVAN